MRFGAVLQNSRTSLYAKILLAFQTTLSASYNVFLFLGWLSGIFAFLNGIDNLISIRYYHSRIREIGCGVQKTSVKQLYPPCGGVPVIC